MREQIIQSIFDEMAINSDIFFLTADMGINLVERFEEIYPDRFVNVGIAEQNLIGISAGLANLGYRPFVYTISNFAIHRCFEQIRNDILLHNYPITIIGTSTGYDNAPLGPTHHIVDDWGVLKAIPGIDIYCPSTVSYSSKLIERVLLENRPSYVRIPKGGHITPDSASNMVKLMGSDNEVLLISYGNPLQNCIEARKHDTRVSVLAMNRLHPLDEVELFDTLSIHNRIYVVEDHFGRSGLYGSICEFVARNSIKGKVLSIAPEGYAFEVGTSPEYFYKKYGLDTASILLRIGI